MTDDISQPPDEREAIVRWLRSAALAHDDIGRDRKGLTNHFAKAQALRDAARDLERGDHLSEQGEG